MSRLKRPLTAGLRMGRPVSNTVKVVTCLKDWREGRATYFLNGTKYPVNSKVDDGIILESENGIKWVSEYQFHKHFLSSKNKGKIKEEKEDPFTTAKEMREYMSAEDRKVVAATYTSMAIGYAEDHKAYEEAKDQNGHLAKAQEWSVFFAKLAEIYQDDN